MKKFLIIGSLFVLVFLVLLIVSREKTQDIKIVFVDKLDVEEPETIKTCVRRSDGKLVLIDVKKNSNENIYLYVLKLYDHYRNSLPLTYTSPLNGNYEVNKVEKKDDKLYIDLKALYIGENFNEFLSALMWTYQGLGIKEIELKINKETFHLEKNEAINIEYEASNIFHATNQLILFYLDGEILPVTYYRNSSEKHIDFLMNKILKRYDHVSYTYEIIDNNLFLSIFDPQYLIKETIIQSLLTNLVNLEVYTNIVIFKNEIVVANN